MMQKVFNKGSLYTKALSPIIITIIIVFSFMEIASLYAIKLQTKNTAETYKESMNLYSNYWSTRLELINGAMLMLINSTDNSYYSDVCYSKDKLYFEIGKVVFQNKIQEQCNMYSKQINMFFYLPDREVFLKSYTDSNKAKFTTINKELTKLIDSGGIKNNNSWELIEADGNFYFYNIYRAEKGWIGAFINCDVILDDIRITLEKDLYVAIVDKEFRDISGTNNQEIEMKKYHRIDSKVDNTEYSLTLFINQYQIYKNSFFVIFSFLIISILTILIAALSIGHYIKILMRPLNKLKKAMKKFGDGDTGARVEEIVSTNEIKILCHTFNKMAEQITKLKIDVYESELENQETKYNFLKVQIQPHFYTNILNLIYGLAEVRKYEEIQKLARGMANYFRYLLNNKEDFVIIERELDCIENYVEIQQIRYPGFIKYYVNADVNISKEMIPPIIIQTFVENSIKHNITVKAEVIIHVTIKTENNQLIIDITDNGEGINEELLLKLREGEDISEAGKHIGIVNVQKRISVLYDNLGVIRISNLETGTNIHMELPEKLLESIE